MLSISTRELTICAIGAALLAVLAQVSIPFAIGVPFTLQTLIVQLFAILLGARKGTYLIFIYLLLGALGLPVFAQMNGGLQAFFGPTGGFLLSFPLMTCILGFVSERTNAWVPLLSTAFAVTLLNLFIGTVQFAFVTTTSLSEAMIACFWPFLFFGIIKAGLSVAFGRRLRAHAGINWLNPIQSQFI